MGITSEESFRDWFSLDHPKHRTFALVPPSPSCCEEPFVFSASQFFPLDLAPSFEPGFRSGDDGKEHNFHFTVEFHQRAIYEPGQLVKVRGDDDIWVFINDELVVDLGGVHPPFGVVTDFERLGLEPGEVYRFSLYFAERNTGGSSLHFIAPKVLSECPFLVRG